MLRTALSICFLFGVAFSSPSANYYVENVLRGPLQNELRALSLSPAVIPNFDTVFYDKVPVFGKVKGTANYTNGQLNGLNTAVRFTECQGPSYSFGTGRINCSIALNYLTTEYKAAMKYGKMPKVNIKAVANITRSILYVEFTQDYGQPARIGNFRFQEIGRVQPKFTGLGKPLNKFLKVLEDGYVAHVGAELFTTVNQRFQYALGRAASQVPMPT